jgi:D-3-phosphoglycerate dehydrogenase
MKNALITARFDPAGLEILRPYLKISQSGYGQTGQVLPLNHFIELLKDVQVLIVELQEVTKEALDASCSLEVIGCCRGTPVNVHVSEATRRGIPVLYTPGRNAVSVAELTIALMLNLARNVLPASRSLHNDEWGHGPASPFIRFRGVELFGKTAGIIGLGAVGREVATRLAALGMRLLISDPYVPPKVIEELGGTLTDLETLLTQSDFVTLHCKLSDETRHIIGTHELGLMKETAYLINTANGQLVEEMALIEALRARRIAGAGLDVFYDEPLALDYPLKELSNVLLTPHIGGATSDVTYHQSIQLATDIERYLTGKRPEAIYNPEVLANSG